ncbi:hypothetical protein ACIBG8_19880 [Nonomuraea sp. NPDC050556]|uniref:hypothetical protein n=1 Tax=Nonomuraea sp. NPDC050556 TaxID=3364369 RepID=UPI00378E4A5F
MGYMRVLVSMAALVVGAVWLAVPGSYPYGAADRVTVGVTHWIERDAGVALMLVSGAFGLLLAAVGRSWPRVATAGAAAQAAFFLLVMSDAGVLSSIGYAAIPLLVAGVVAVVVAGCVRRYPVAFVAAALLVAGAVVGLGNGVIIGYAYNLAKGFGSYAGRIGWAWGMALAAAAWAWVALRGRGTAERAGGPVRWGRWVTVAAAVGALPYAVARLSWATPWPLGGYDPVGGHVILVMPGGGDAATRLQGFMIGMSSVLGLVLTLGLISRWGEVFPRWMPRVGGRDVPVMLAVVPGTFAAAVLCVAAPGVLAGAVQMDGWFDRVVFVLLFPCPIWGPLLGAAVYAYWRRRTA